MGAKERRAREKADMRDAILQAAAKIIVEEGYEKLSMRKIAGAIDYTPTTIYLYYEDKAQIVGDIAKDVYRKIARNTQKVMRENEGAPTSKLLELGFKEFVYTITGNAEMGKAVMRSGTSAIFGPDENPDAPEEPGVEVLRKLLLKGQQESELRKLDDNMSWMLVTALIGFSLNAIENQLHLSANWHALVHTYAEMLVNGLLQKGAAQ